jgi:hypothetical protein
MAEINKVHADRVAAWIAKSSKGLPPDQLVKLFEQAFTALWHRSRLTISTITLVAIMDRTLFNSTEHFPVLLALKVDKAGLSFDEFRKQSHLGEKDLIEAFQCLLIEFLTITGSISGEIVTPYLYDELSRVVLEPKLTLIKNGEEK